MATFLLLGEFGMKNCELGSVPHFFLLGAGWSAVSTCSPQLLQGRICLCRVRLAVVRHCLESVIPKAEVPFANRHNLDLST